MGEDELRQLLELVPDAMLLVRPDGTLAFANHQAEQLLGYTADELARLPLERLVPERFRDRHAECYAAYFAAPVVRPMGGHLELFALHQDGRELPVDISLGPVETPAGRLVAAVLRDISHRKQAE
jgi:PAS domain S-box-containing protein